jgi:hypothetical protein
MMLMNLSCIRSSLCLKAANRENRVGVIVLPNPPVT